MKRFLFLILVLVGCDTSASSVEQSPRVYVTTPLVTAPKVHSVAEQQAYNCERVCATAHMSVIRFTPGDVGKSSCVCGKVAEPVDNTPGVGTGIAIGVGAEVGRHVGRAVLDELF